MVIPIIIESGNSRALFALLQAAGGLQVVVQLTVGVCNTPYSQAVVHFMHPTVARIFEFLPGARQIAGFLRAGPVSETDFSP